MNRTGTVLGALVSGTLVLICCSRPRAQQAEQPTLNDNLFAWEKPVFVPNNLPITKSATCRFKKGLSASYQKQPASKEPDPRARIYYSASNEDEANSVSFVDLDTASPKVQTNGGQGNLSVINDDGEAVTVLNRSPGAETVEMYTIFRRTGIAIFSQQQNSVLIGPFGVLEMGYCN